jgi:hypothetical protein
MRLTIFYEGGPDLDFDNGLDTQLGFGEATDSGTLLMGPHLRDVSWKEIPEDANRSRIEQIALEVCGVKLVKIEYEVTETWWAPGWRDK